MWSRLPTYFTVFSIWNEQNLCLSWAETIEWAALFDLTTVPVLYTGIWDESIIGNLYTPRWQSNEMEGYVVRLSASFPYSRFRRSVAKYVRADHARTRLHWRHGQEMIRNELAHPTTNR